MKQSSINAFASGTSAEQAALLRQQQTQSAQGHYYPVLSMSRPDQEAQSVGNPLLSGTLSPLEIIDQAEDDEKLLAALEGLTLDSNDAEEALSANGNAPGAQIEENDARGSGEPSGEHGTRTDFIKDVSERLITRVNTEASNIEEAKGLMHQYMIEFCAEYDRCGYSLKAGRRKLLSENQQSCTDRTSASSAYSAAGHPSKNPNQKQSQHQMAFDNQILKKGVRVLSKNLQRSHGHNNVKDQQLKVMKNILVHQKSQITRLQAQVTSAQQQLRQVVPAIEIETLDSPTSQGSSSSLLTGLMDQLHFSNQPDSAMMTAEQTSAQVTEQAYEQAASRAIQNRSLHLQSMKTMQNFSANDQKPDIY